MGQKNILGIIFVLGGTLLIATYALSRHKTAPQRAAMAVASDVCQQLMVGENSDVLDNVILPSVYADRTDAEKMEFLTKALRDEMSEEGLRTLLKKGEFGPLLDVFPNRGKTWAEKAGVPVDECVAFRLEQNGVVAELVIHQQGGIQRIIRANDIKQLAE